MEEEGIYYFFEYEKSKHTMILVDDLASHKADPWYSSLEYRSTIHEGTDEYLVGYRASKEFGTGTVTLNDYDFEKPKSPLQVKQQTANRATAAEWYGYPGMYTASDDGQRLARIRMESEDAAREQVQFGGNARGMRAGAKFTLTNHTTEAANKDYLIVASELSMEKAVSKSVRGQQWFIVQLCAAKTQSVLFEAVKQPCALHPRTAYRNRMRQIG